MEKAWKPTREQILAARGKTVPDLIAPGLRVLFCGINPGLYTAAVGHHFARPGNRFWPALHRAGFTPGLFSAFEEEKLLPRGYGIVNLVEHATARADELSAQDLARGGRGLVEKIRLYRPGFCAVLGLGAYRTAFAHPEATPGPRPEKIGGVSRLWVLPSPSGINASYPMEDLVGLLRELKAVVDRAGR